MVERRDSGTRAYWRVAVTASVVMIGASDRAWATPPHGELDRPVHSN